MWLAGSSRNARARAGVLEVLGAGVAVLLFLAFGFRAQALAYPLAGWIVLAGWLVYRFARLEPGPGPGRDAESTPD